MSTPIKRFADTRTGGQWHFCGQPVEQIRNGLRIKGYCVPGAATCGPNCPGCGEKVHVADVVREKPRFHCRVCHNRLDTLAAEDASRADEGCVVCLAVSRCEECSEPTTDQNLCYANGKRLCQDCKIEAQSMAHSAWVASRRQLLLTPVAAEDELGPDDGECWYGSSFAEALAA